MPPKRKLIPNTTPSTTGWSDQFVTEEEALIREIKTQLTRSLTYAFALGSTTNKARTAAVRLIHDNVSICEFIQDYYSLLTELPISFAEKSKAIQLSDSHLRQALQRFRLEQQQRIDQPATYLLWNFYPILNSNLAPLKSATTRQIMDNRVSYTEERLQRRFDSLSRLLATDANLSVCTAVTICENELIIAANCSNITQSNDLAIILSAKLQIVRNEIQKVIDKPELIRNYSFYHDAIEQLKKCGGTTIPDFILIQALYKLIQATLQSIPDEIEDNEDYFTHEVKETFLYSNEFMILVPAQHPEKKLHVLNVYHGTPNDDQPTFVLFPQSTKKHQIHHFHAEQMLVYYLQRSKKYNLEDPTLPKIRVGISKLPCLDCAALNNFARISLRGTSHASYPNTANLFPQLSHVAAPSQEAYSSPVRTTSSRWITYAEQSPWTPDNDLNSSKKVRGLVGQSKLPTITEEPENSDTNLSAPTDVESSSNTSGLSSHSMFSSRTIGTKISFCIDDFLNLDNAQTDEDSSESNLSFT